MGMNRMSYHYIIAGLVSLKRLTLSVPDECDKQRGFHLLFHWSSNPQNFNQARHEHEIVLVYDCFNWIYTKLWAANINIFHKLCRRL
jgi:hypothetical protein